MNDQPADDGWVADALAGAVHSADPEPDPADASPDTTEPATPPDDEPAAAEDADDGPNFAKGVLEWIVVLAGAVAVALILRAFLFQAFWIPSQSMEATLLERDRVLVNKLSYDLHDVNRGDIVVFRRPDDQPGQIRDLIKRVIALEGESVQGRENVIYVDGQRVVEPYLDPADVIADFGPVIIEPDHVFVMGDNRDESYDSRFFGTVHVDRIVGRAFVIFWPLDRIGSL